MIQFWNDKIGEIYVGSDKIKEVYHGNDLVWSGSKLSYIIKTDGTRIYFDLDNTPIDSFYADLDTAGYDEELEVPYLIYNINGNEVKSHKIKEVHFTDGYSNVTTIGDGFLGGCSSLTSVDLSPLSNVTTIGNSFLGSCSGLTSVDLSPLSNVTSITHNFLYSCSGLTSVDLSPLSNVTSIGDYFLSQMGTLSEVKMGAIIPPTLGNRAFYSTTVQSILVPCESVDSYKVATNWSSKADIIKGDC